MQLAMIGLGRMGANILRPPECFQIIREWPRWTGDLAPASLGEIQGSPGANG